MRAARSSCSALDVTFGRISRIGKSLSGSLVIVDGLATEFRKLRLRHDPACPLCGPDATIRDLSAHQAHAHAG